MAHSEKLCRSFALALAETPSATQREAQALLTPEALATMSTLTSIWLASQGVPIVGEAVDAALASLGIILMTAQVADLSNALWSYVHLTAKARHQEELEAASAHLARAIALVGVNIVTFILTKKVAGRIERSPPAAPPARTAMPPGTLHLESSVQVSSPPSAHMATTRGGARSPPSSPAGPPVSNSPLLLLVESWRKPKLLADGRIMPYPGTRNPPHPIPNLGRNRAGESVTRGKHTVRFDKDGFPEFETPFETLLDGSHIGSGKKELHFRSANQNLFSSIQENPSLAQKLGLSAKEVEALAHAAEPPPGYTWHHHQDVGRMQLVPLDAHRLTMPHTGGMAIWGGGHR